MSEWFTVIPGAVLSSKELSSSAKVVYGAISSFTANGAKPAFPSHVAIAERAGLQERSVSRLVKELVKYGALVATRRGRRQTNTYQVTALKSDVTEMCDHHPAQGDDAGLRTPSIKRIHKKNSTQTFAEAEEIYAVYASKIKPGGRADAIRSITKLLKDYRPVELMNAINRYAASKKGRCDVEFRYQANNFFGRKAYFTEYLEETCAQHPTTPVREMTPEKLAMKQRLIDAGQA